MPSSHEGEIILDVPYGELDPSDMAHIALNGIQDVLDQAGKVFEGTLQDEETGRYTQIILAQLLGQLVQDNPGAVIRGVKLRLDGVHKMTGLEAATVEMFPYDQTGHRLIAADEESEYAPNLTIQPARSKEPRMLVGCKRIPGTGGHTVTVLSKQLTGGILEPGQPIPNRIETPLQRTGEPLLVTGDSVEITSIPVFDRTRLIQPSGWNMGLLNSNFEHPEPFEDEVFLSRTLTWRAVNNLLRAKRIAALSGEPTQG